MESMKEVKQSDLLKSTGESASSTVLELEQQGNESREDKKRHVRNTIIVASVGAGVQFSWALQLSLLTPYVQLLGIPHKWAAFIWLCGPISGMIVQPSVGFYSDRCTSKYGRRRPFIAAGSTLVVFSIFLIGFAADLGHLFGDKPSETIKPRAISVFVLGFWILDVANNMLTGPCRALLADLSGDDHKRMRRANALFSFFISIGNILGYAAGSFSKLHNIFPFTNTAACNVYCANLKSCFLIAVVLLLSVVTLCLTLVKEETYCKPKEEEKTVNQVKVSDCGKVVVLLRDIPKAMWILLLVTFLNWMAWFPFFLFDTDWMGREVYGGEVGIGNVYDKGVRAGTMGLMLNSVLLGITSLSIGMLVRGVGSVKRLWGLANFLLAGCMAMTVLVTKMAKSHRTFDANGLAMPPSPGVKICALILFTLLGIPLAVTYSIPFALASIFSNTAGAGQGLSLGILNLAIVIPQMLVSVTSGPWDALFGGGNLPAFVVGAIAAALSGVVALTVLPSPPADSETIEIMNGVGGHS